MFDNKKPSGNGHAAPLAGKELSPWLARRLARPVLSYARLPASVTRRSANRLQAQRLIGISRTAIIPLFRASILLGKQTPSIPSSWKKLDLLWLKKRGKLNPYTYLRAGAYTLPEETAATPAPGEKPFIQKPFSSLKPGLSRSILKPVVTPAERPIRTSPDSAQADLIESQSASPDTGAHAPQISNTERPFPAADKRALSVTESRAAGPAAGKLTAQRSIMSEKYQTPDLKTKPQHLTGLSRIEESPVIARVIIPAVQPVTQTLSGTENSESTRNQAERPARNSETYQPLKLKTDAQPLTGLSQLDESRVIPPAILPAVQPGTRTLSEGGNRQSTGIQAARPARKSETYQPLNLKTITQPPTGLSRSEESPVPSAILPAVQPDTRPQPAAGNLRSTGNQAEMNVVVSGKPQPVNLKHAAKTHSRSLKSEKNLVIGRGKHTLLAKAAAPLSLSTPVIKSGRPLISPAKQPLAQPASGATSAPATAATAVPPSLPQSTVFNPHSGDRRDTAGRVVSTDFPSVTRLETELSLTSPGGLAEKSSPGVTTRLNLETGLPAADSKWGVKAPVVIERSSSEKYSRPDIFETVADRVEITAEIKAEHPENRQSTPRILHNTREERDVTPLTTTVNKAGSDLDRGRPSPHKMSHPLDLHILRTVGFVEDISGSLKLNKVEELKSGQKYNSSSGVKSTLLGLDLKRSPYTWQHAADKAGALETERPVRQNQAESGERIKSSPIQIFSVRRTYSHQPVLPLSGNEKGISMIKSEKPETALFKSRVSSLYPETNRPVNLKPLDLILSSQSQPQTERDDASSRGIYRDQNGISTSVFRRPESPVSRRSFVSRAYAPAEIPQPPDTAVATAASPSAAAGETETKTDLKALAREVYPYIRRMIILDRERLPL
jgi:hypothetical protein